MRRLSWGLVLLLLVAASAYAATVPIGPNETVTVTAGDAEISIRNKGGGSGSGYVESFFDVFTELVIDPFELIDGSLQVTVTGLLPSEYDIMLKRAYDRPCRTRGGRLLRERSLRAMIYRPVRARYEIAGLIDRGDRPRIDRARFRSGDYTVGWYGVDTANNYVWAILEGGGGGGGGGANFAIAGMPVPEPITLACLAAGAAGLIYLRRRRF